MPAPGAVAALFFFTWQRLAVTAALYVLAINFGIGMCYHRLLTHGGNQTPKYEEGWPDYGRRFGAAVGDFGTQSFFSAGVFATLLRQDPRYFRKGPASGVARRAWYSASRLFVCRNDAGRPAFNGSGLLGMSLGIAASNLYYPSASRTGTIMAGRVETSLLGGVTGNFMSEFWPDIQRKFFHKKPKE